MHTLVLHEKIQQRTCWKVGIIAKAADLGHTIHEVQAFVSPAARPLHASDEVMHAGTQTVGWAEAVEVTQVNGCFAAGKPESY